MRKVRKAGKKYFYGIGQRCRIKGLTKEQGIQLYKIESALPYALIAYDAGYRGLAY